MKWGVQTLKGIGKRRGLRSRRYWCDGEYRPAPWCPLKDAPHRDSASFPPPSRKPPRHPYSPTAMESTARLQSDGFSPEDDTGVTFEQSSLNTLDLNGRLMDIGEDAGTKANSVGSWRFPTKSREARAFPNLRHVRRVRDLSLAMAHWVRYAVLPIFLRE